MPPQNTHKLRWVHSYETIRFDTPDGDIDKGQFCRWKAKFIIRDTPKNNGQFKLVDKLDTTGMQEVFITAERGAYYDVFVLPDGRRYRIPSTAAKYATLREKNAPQPAKEVSGAQITDIEKNDDLWR